MSDDASVFCGLTHAPDGSGMKLCALPLCHAGTIAEAEAELRAAARVRSAGHGPGGSRCRTRRSTPCWTTASPGAR